MSSPYYDPAQLPRTESTFVKTGPEHKGILDMGVGKQRLSDVWAERLRKQGINKENQRGPERRGQAGQS